MSGRTAIMKQIFTVPELIPALNQQMKVAAGELVKGKSASFCAWAEGGPEVSQYRKIILTGCGDSYCAALASRYAFMEWTGMEVEVITTVDLARYYAKCHLSDGIITVIISCSGRGARIVEAARRIRRLGGFVVAITEHQDSALALNADQVLLMDIPKVGRGPGLRSYCGCMIALFHMALAMSSRAVGRGAVEAEINVLARQLEQHLPEWEKSSLIQAKRCQNATSLEFIGAGCNYASTWFGYAKALEITGLPCWAIDTEDWFHMSFFIRDVYHTPTFLVTNRGHGDESRARELIRVAEEMGRTLICITDNPELPAACKIITPALTCPLLQVMVQYIPIVMILSYLGEAMGETDFRGGKDNWSACVNLATIVNSEEHLID